MQSAWKFEFFNSLPFWGALAVTALLVRAAGARPRLRGTLLLLCSSALLLAIPRFEPLHLSLVWAIALAALLAVRALVAPRATALSRRLRLLAAALGVGAVLAALAFFKYRFVQDALRGPVAAPGEPLRYLGLLGVSYFSFKAIHVIVEAYRGTIQRVGLLTFLNYILFFPSFISGPIQRYPEFVPGLEAPRAGALREDLAAGGERIVHGMFKKFVLVPILLPYTLTAHAGALESATFGQVAIGLYAQALYFFCDFAGYTDLAIGAGRLLGVKLPENFRSPFTQRNIRELWSSWHISLTSWLVDYVYWPLVRKLRNLDYFRPRPVLLSIVGMNVTFLACGLWHGDTWAFVLWGAYHGLGISVLQLYQRQKKRIRVPWLQRYYQSRASRVVGAVGTFHFFAAGLLLFVLDLDQVRTVLAAITR